MLRKIILLRHAKSSWKDPSLRDFDRPLSKRGMNDIKLMKVYITSLVKEVDEIYSSPSLRTSQTINQIAPKFSHVKYLDSLYLGNFSNVLTILESIQTQIKTVMIVGHNPCIQETMETLSKNPVEKFPTCAAAVFSLKNGWSKTAKPIANLEKFIKPRDFK